MATPGDLDPSFGTRGTARIFAGEIVGAKIGYVSPNAVAVQADGKILVAAAGGSYHRGREKRFGYGPAQFLVIRLNEDGSLDDGFGVHGVVRVPFPAEAWATGIRQRRDGGIIAVGAYDNVYEFGDSVSRRTKDFAPISTSKLVFALRPYRPSARRVYQPAAFP